ncbi:MAG: entericidin [Hylemonella sp.]|nr:entericidin [Hylemonella sp.]MDH5709719.1 entericidin [Hylemonella sp.]
MSQRILKITLLALGLALSACNTMKGLGEDLNHAGQKIGEVVKGKQ